MLMNELKNLKNIETLKEGFQINNIKTYTSGMGQTKVVEVEKRDGTFEKYIVKNKVLMSQLNHVKNLKDLHRTTFFINQENCCYHLDYVKI